MSHNAPTPHSLYARKYNKVKTPAPTYTVINTIYGNHILNLICKVLIVTHTQNFKWMMIIDNVSISIETLHNIHTLTDVCSQSHYIISEILDNMFYNNLTYSLLAEIPGSFESSHKQCPTAPSCYICNTLLLSYQHIRHILLYCKNTSLCNFHFVLNVQKKHSSTKTLHYRMV